MPTPRSTRAAADIRIDLLSGELRAGQKIVQESLAARYGISRIPLREALAQLQAEGLVVHEPNRGYFVARLRAEDMREVYRLREILEAEAITRACRHLSEADIERIVRIADDVESALSTGDLARIGAANRSFHFAVFEAAGMPRLTRILAGLWDSTEAYRGLYFQDPANHQHIIDEHAALLDALRRRDAKDAVVAQAAHRTLSLRNVSDRLPD
ncbi:MAG: GntR family transcriptional regulator [Candidatus Nanopelagicales bacterium]